MTQGIRENVVGFQVDTAGVENAIASIVHYVQASGADTRCKWLACLNPHSYTQSTSDREFAAALHQSDWLIPDGSGIVLASRLLKGSIAERVTGSDIFEGVSRAMNGIGGGRVFFLGSTEETLSDIQSHMALDYPNLDVVGTYSPPFRAEYSESELDEMVAVINAASPDLLWVGMTAPKQEKWLFQQAPRLNVKFAAAIGAVFDFYAGNIKRSHPLFQRLHLEWLPRLLQEPKRLWRRMAISAPIFVWHLVRQRFGFIKKSNP